MAPAVLAREPITATDEERSTLAKVHQAISHPPDAGTQPMLVGPNGEHIPLPASLFRVLGEAVEALRRGEAVTVVPIHQELTTQQAADILNVSRQYLVRLLEDGKIPFTRTGTHRRITYDDLIDYRRRRDADRARALEQLTQMGQEMGHYRGR